jgi:hypothetical protein
MRKSRNLKRAEDGGRRVTINHIIQALVHGVAGIQCLLYWAFGGDCVEHLYRAWNHESMSILHFKNCLASTSNCPTIFAFSVPVELFGRNG